MSDWNEAIQKMQSGSPLSTPAAQGTVALPSDITEAQINSACLSYRHDFGLLDEHDKERLRFVAKEWLHAWRKEFDPLAPSLKVSASPSPAASPASPSGDAVLTIDALAQEIRRVDGKHSLGAGALAEAILPFIARAIASLASDATPAPTSGSEDGGEIEELLKRARMAAISENTLYGGTAGDLYNDLADALVALAKPASEPAGGDVRAEPKAEYAFGRGKVVIEGGLRYGAPAVFIYPAKQPGTVNTSAAREVRPSDAFLENEVVLTFPSEAQADYVMDALYNRPRGSGFASPHPANTDVREGLQDNLLRRAAAADDECRTDDADLMREASAALSSSAAPAVEVVENLTRQLWEAKYALAKSQEYAQTWHRICQTIATVLGLPEPEEDFAVRVRDWADAHPAPATVESAVEAIPAGLPYGWVDDSNPAPAPHSTRASLVALAARWDAIANNKPDPAPWMKCAGELRAALAPATEWRKG